MAWRWVEFTDAAKKQMSKIGHTEAKRILYSLRKRIESADDPRLIGKPLRGKLSDLWRYRVGDYRGICELRNEKLEVLVVRIGHR